MKKSLFKVTSQSQDKKGNSLTASDFFIENNANGYYTKPDFISTAESLERTEPAQLVETFENCRNGHRIKLNTITRYDKSGKAYMWNEFQYARATRGLRVPSDSGMVRFITDYAHGRINVDFTFDELSDEAFKD